MNTPSYLTANLTTEQRDAVLYSGGPLLIIAGPGSGRAVVCPTIETSRRGDAPAGRLYLDIAMVVTAAARRRCLYHHRHGLRSPCSAGRRPALPATRGFVSPAVCDRTGRKRRPQVEEVD